MSTIQRINLIGMYNYDERLFRYLELPEGVDKDTFINNILLRFGERIVLYTNAEFYAQAIGMWGRKWNKSFIRILQAIDAEYNPIHNYDRFEEYTDTERVDRDFDSKNTSTNNTTSTATNENKVSAFNSSDYQPDSQSLDGATSSNNYGATAKSAEDMDRTLKHTAHLYGNIGVTTSAQMQKEVMELYKNHNIYDIIGDVFANEMLLYL